MYNIINEYKLSRLVERLAQSSRRLFQSIPGQSNTLTLYTDASQIRLGSALYQNAQLLAVNSQPTYRAEATLAPPVPMQVEANLVNDYDEASVIETLRLLSLGTIRTLDTPQRVPPFVQPCRNEQIRTIYESTRLNDTLSIDTLDLRDAFRQVPIAHASELMGLRTSPTAWHANQPPTTYVDDVLYNTHGLSATVPDDIETDLRDQT